MLHGSRSSGGGSHAERERRRQHGIREAQRMYITFQKGRNLELHGPLKAACSLGLLFGGGHAPPAPIGLAFPRSICVTVLLRAEGAKRRINGHPLRNKLKVSILYSIEIT
jgi:hypothetical protein